jgi:hypothetical protein
MLIEKGVPLDENVDENKVLFPKAKNKEKGIDPTRVIKD